MAISPRIVTEETWITWDGVRQRLAKGQVLDVQPGSALEAAIGAGRLVPLHARTAPQAAPEPAQEPQDTPAAAEPADEPAQPEETPSAPRRVRAAKTSDSNDSSSDDKDGESA